VHSLLEEDVRETSALSSSITYYRNTIKLTYESVFWSWRGSMQGSWRVPATPINNRSLAFSSSSKTSAKATPVIRRT